MKASIISLNRPYKLAEHLDSLLKEISDIASVEFKERNREVVGFVKNRTRILKSVNAISALYWFTYPLSISPNELLREVNAAYGEDNTDEVFFQASKAGPPLIHTYAHFFFFPDYQSIVNVFRHSNFCDSPRDVIKSQLESLKIGQNLGEYIRFHDTDPKDLVDAIFKRKNNAVIHALKIYADDAEIGLMTEKHKDIFGSIVGEKIRGTYDLEGETWKSLRITFNPGLPTQFEIWFNRPGKNTSTKCFTIRAHPLLPLEELAKYIAQFLDVLSEAPMINVNRSLDTSLDRFFSDTSNANSLTG